MTLDQYQHDAMETAIYPRENGIAYTVLGLAGETGEIAEKVKKTIRDHGGIFDESIKYDIAREAGDVLWYLAALARELGMTLDDIARINLDKLRSRSLRDTLRGNGDNR